MMKKIAMLLAMTMVIASLSGCGSKEAEASADSTKSENADVAVKDNVSDTAGEAITLKYAEINSEEHPMAQGAKKFAELVKEKTDGRISVEVYYSGTLGDEKTSMQALQIGTLDFFRGNANAMPDYGCDLMNATALPYVFADLDHLSNVLRSDIGDQLLSSIQESGTQMVGLGFMEEGPRNLFFTKNAVTNLDGLKGLKIRVPETEVMTKTFTSLGANPTAISYSELYTSLQTGVVDGAENAITGYITNGFYEVAPYYLKDAHTFGAGLLLMSEKSWSNLSEDDQKILKEAATEAMDYVLEISKKTEDEYYAQLEELGAQALEVEDIEEWNAAVQSLYEEYSPEVQEMIKEIKAMK